MMNGENHLISSLANESESYSFKDSTVMHKSKISLPEVSSWDDRLLYIPSAPTSKNINHLRMQSLTLMMSPSKPDKDILITEPKIIIKRDFPKVPPSQSSSLYKIAKICLNDKEIFENEKHTIKKEFKHKLPILNKKSFSSAHLTQKKSRSKLDNKPFVTADIDEVLSLLKPGLKNPIKKIVTPQLKSKTEIYRSFFQKKHRKNYESVFLSTVSMDLGKNKFV
ncbi:hypothetical protein SteCoe_17143 [Stentor coeruleus]|uniref:Uncharacterized protein n=1 Tax=Stentor coeruleus TaxID=5963 RepID=A0A1R2BZT9_9CILI|nr:hypothetical protein SteCoe_17143 [Stentor coeruleus]